MPIIPNSKPSKEPKHPSELTDEEKIKYRFEGYTIKHIADVGGPSRPELKNLTRDMKNDNLHMNNAKMTNQPDYWLGGRRALRGWNPKLRSP